MKTVLALILFTFFLNGHAQKDTLDANQTHSLAIFFPSPIRQALPGSGNFTFSYNRDTFQNFGLLQASPGPSSNLLVLTNDGQVYSFALQYRKELQQTSRFIRVNESIGHEKQIMKTRKPKMAMDSTTPNIQRKKFDSKRTDYYENVCSSLLLQDTKNLKSKRKDGMGVTLQHVLYRNREVYLVIEISNKSGIDFELEYLKVFKVNGNKRKKSSYQKVRLIPVYAHDYQALIKNNTNMSFVYVLPKFTLGDSERILFELKERRGSRNLQLVLYKVVL